MLARNLLLAVHLVLLARPAIGQRTIRVQFRANYGDDPSLVVFTADGRAWTPSIDRILVVDSRGDTTVVSNTLPETDRYVYDLVLGSDGAVWGRSLRHVLRVDPATHAVQLIPFANDIEAIGAGPDGAMWVITRSGGTRALVRLSTAGAVPAAILSAAGAVRLFGR